MSEINERAIIIFLLKQMGFKSANERNFKRPYYQLSGGKIILFATKSEPGFYFFPFSDIRHAWMVVEALPYHFQITREDLREGNVGEHAGRVSVRIGWEGGLIDEFYIGGTSIPEAIIIAAAFALATDEQCKGFGL